jgi:hypothetical protein
LVRQGKPARADFCGWTGLAPIALYHEFISANPARALVPG